MTSDDPYRRKPNIRSAPSDWHEISFQISVDVPVDWDAVDLRKWAQVVARYTALMMADSIEQPEPEEDEEAPAQVLKTLIMGVKVDRISFVDDDELHSMIDEYDDTGD